MHKKIAWLLTVLLFMATTSVGATSLWSDTSSAGIMFADRKARAVGDTVTIIIEERTSAKNTAGTASSKETNVDMGAGSGFLLKAITAVGSDYSDSYDSSGSTTRGNSLSARITAQVIEVKPNGNLVISGTQTIKVNGEDQKISVTGTIRPDDISPNNTVPSTLMADASVKVDGKGSIGSKQKPGIVHRLFGWLF